MESIVKGYVLIYGTPWAHLPTYYPPKVRKNNKCLHLAFLTQMFIRLLAMLKTEALFLSI